jgi:hypothetical protein
VALQIRVPIDLGLNEIRNVLLQVLAADPSPTEAQIYYNSVSHEVRYYNGTAWVPLTAGAVNAVTGSAPIVSSGGTAPDISIVAATGSVPGSMSAADKAKLDAAASLATVSTLVLRDASGRARFVDPANAADAATKGYVDALINGADWGESCVLVATTNIASLTGVATAIDGVTATAGMRVLLTAQSTGSQNGPWVVAAGAWSRPVDYVAGTVISPNRAYFIEQGTAKHDTGWTLSTNTNVQVDTDSSAWTQFTGLGEVTAGNGLTKTGDTISVLADGSTITVSASGIKVTSPPLRYSADVGGATSVAITHSLGTRDVVVTLYRNSTPWDTVLCDVERTDANTVTFKFSVAPSAAQYRCVILG